MRRVRVKEHVPHVTLYYGQCVHEFILRDGAPEVCVNCGATCRRDPATNRICEYDATREETR